MTSQIPLFDTPKAIKIAGYAQVALEQGIDAGASGLSYAVPESLADLQVGERVIVPLGKRDKSVPGYVVQLTEHCSIDKVKPIHARDPQAISLTLDLIELAQWIASYYCSPLGMVLQTMLPAAVKRGTGSVSQLMVAIAAKLPDPLPKLTRVQRAVLDQASQHANRSEPWVEVKTLAHEAGAKTVTPVQRLVKQGLLTTRWQSAIRAKWDDRLDELPETNGAVVLTPDQHHVIRHLVRTVHCGFGVHLLYGVTGSGKTEVYLRVIEALLAHEQSSDPTQRPGESRPNHSHAPGAIVLVPEIALTPQTVRRFKARFESVAVLHSGLSAAQRHEQWQRLRRGETRIVIGARSAVFAPMPNIGVIIVDEEHDSSYKQDQLPRYHARDVAIKRGQLLNIPVVLGSATPSLESYYNATERGTFELLKLPVRVTGLTLPQVEIVDMQDERRKRYAYSGKAGLHLLSLRLEAAIRKVLEDKGQVMLLLNRRGYANYIACPDQNCGWMMNCSYCDVTMVYHKDQSLPAGGLLRCHHCGAEQILPQRCPQCDRRVTVFGLGTQRVEEQVMNLFPSAHLQRMDSDTMRTSRHYDQSLNAFRAGEIDILVGTQMIAKGLDFPNVRLVGVISADTALHLPDFRASERTFQLIAQVAGRTGRGKQPGRVIVQTFNPHDAAILLAAQHDYEGNAHREIALRKQVGLPPVTRMARIVVRDRDLGKCREQAAKLAAHLAASNAGLGAKVRLRGPAPCPIARIAGYYRQQIELIAPNAAVIQILITDLRNGRLLKSDRQTAVDVDPVTLL